MKGRHQGAFSKTLATLASVPSGDVKEYMNLGGGVYVQAPASARNARVRRDTSPASCHVLLTVLGGSWKARGAKYVEFV